MVKKKSEGFRYPPKTEKRPFDSSGYGQCFYGFEVLAPSQPIVEPSEVWKVLTKHFKLKFSKCSSSGRWPAWNYWTQRQQWGDEVLRLIKFGNMEFDEEIREVVNALFDVSSAFAEEMSDSSSS